VAGNMYLTINQKYGFKLI